MNTQNKYESASRKPYKDLTFTDDYMFCRVLENDPELCRQLLEVVLDKDIRKVELVSPQYTISVTSDIKSVRFDVYLNDDEGSVFDLEMQALRKPEMPKRSRYYQSVSDVDHLSAGMDYGMLPDTYVVFICTFDPFKRGLPRYDFRNVCIDDPGIELEDGAYKVFLNARYKNTDMTAELKALLDYLCGKEPSSELTRYISDSVLRAKNNRRWERDYMLFEEKLREASEEREKILMKMVDYLLSDNRIEDLKKASEDAEFRKMIIEEMLEHYSGNTTVTR